MFFQLLDSVDELRSLSASILELTTLYSTILFISVTCKLVNPPGPMALINPSDVTEHDSEKTVHSKRIKVH